MSDLPRAIYNSCIVFTLRLTVDFVDQNRPMSRPFLTWSSLPNPSGLKETNGSIFLQRTFGTSQLTWSVVTKRCRSQGPVAIRWCVATDGWQGKSRKHVSLYSQRILLPLERSGVSILQQLNLSFIPRVACSKHH